MVYWQGLLCRQTVKQIVFLQRAGLLMDGGRSRQVTIACTHVKLGGGFGRLSGEGVPSHAPASYSRKFDSTSTKCVFHLVTRRPMSASRSSGVQGTRAFSAVVQARTYVTHACVSCLGKQSAPAR